MTFIDREDPMYQSIALYLDTMIERVECVATWTVCLWLCAGSKR